MGPMHVQKHAPRPGRPISSRDGFYAYRARTSDNHCTTPEHIKPVHMGRRARATTGRVCYLQDALRRHLEDGLDRVGGQASVVQRVPVLLQNTNQTTTDKTKP